MDEFMEMIKEMEQWIRWSDGMIDGMIDGAMDQIKWLLMEGVEE